MVVSSNSAAVNVQLTGVVVDLTSGSILASTNTITVNAGMSQTQQLMTFATPYALAANTSYYIGVAQTNGTVTAAYPFSSLTPPYTINNFYRASPVGSALVNVDRGYLAIGAVVTTTALNISALASKTVVCKKDGPNTVTLTATGSGPNTFTWTPGGVGASVAVTPSVAGASTATGVVYYTVVGTETVTGCKTAASTVSVAVSLCTGLATNNSNGYDIKLFPNPAVNGKSTITGLVGTNSITVLNTLGQVVLTQVVTEESTSIDLSNFASGNYLVKITGDNSESRLIKVVNQN